MSHNHHYSKRLLGDSAQYHYLFSQHQALEEEIQTLKKHPSTDITEMTALKRQKLHIVDEMERLKKARLLN